MSSVQSQTPSSIENKLPQFKFRDLKVGKVLGRGFANNVYEIFIRSSSMSCKPVQNSSVDKTVDMHLVEMPDTFPREEIRLQPMDMNLVEKSIKILQEQFRCKRRVSLNQSYAMKVPRFDNFSSYKQCVETLLTEAQLLSSVDHKNIIKIHGVSSSDMENDTTRPYFIILDKLSITLEEQLKIWTVENQAMNNIFDVFDLNRKSFLYRNLTVARDIASAMQYLHEREIIHRDLKPDNIGFDSENVVKLFDFGFAVKLDASEKMDDGNYELEQGIGTCRYMAPEVEKCRTYNELADVYSFGILMWQILTLQVPFQDYNCIEEWVKAVVIGGERPKVNNSWPLQLKTLMHRCWSEDVENRPDFKTIVEILDTTLHKKNFVQL